MGFRDGRVDRVGVREPAFVLYAEQSALRVGVLDFCVGVGSVSFEFLGLLAFVS